MNLKAVRVTLTFKSIGLHESTEVLSIKKCKGLNIKIWENSNILRSERKGGSGKEN